MRGDHPQLYQNRRFSERDCLFRRHWVNDLLDGGEENRRRNETVLLMFYYHYSLSVRRKGREAKAVIVPDIYIDGVERVQKAMQQFLAARGIGIEANPSSNYLISTMDSYDEHPISSLYNLGLVVEPEKIQACTQMHISINTDDKGVFQTSLENEYALMSCALEQVTDELGNKKYHKQMVYDWLEHIRGTATSRVFLLFLERHIKRKILLAQLLGGCYTMNIAIHSKKKIKSEGKMKKRILYYALALLCTVSIAGCNSKEKGSIEDNVNTEEESNQGMVHEKEDGTQNIQEEKENNDEIVEVDYDNNCKSLLGGGITYEIDGEEASVTGYQDLDMEEFSIPDKIHYEDKDYPVTAIAESAFESSTNLVRFIAGNNLTDIGQNAFYSCDTIASADLSDSVTSIGSNAFGSCTALEEVKGCSSLTQISDNAFCGCTALREFTVPAAANLGAEIFTDCESLEKCEFEEGASVIADGMFTNCTALAEMTLPQSIVAINAEAFWGCSALTQLQLPDKLVTIGDKAFYDSGIKELKLPQSISAIKFEMLDGMSDLEKILVPEAKKAAYEEQFDEYGITIDTYQS